MAKRIATVSGTALVPGISKNGRLYSKEAIAKAVARAQDRIAAGTLSLTDRLGEAQRELQPLSQKTHHAADDDSTLICGRLTSLTLGEDGSAKFTADIANTPKGQAIAALADTSDGKPAFLRGVSIRGAWMGEPRTETIDGKVVQTCDDLMLDGLDYTGNPGVSGAVIDSCVPVSESTADGRVFIFESVQEATLTAGAVESAPEAHVPTFPTLASLIAESGLTLNQIHAELGAPAPAADGPADLAALDRAFAVAAVQAVRLESPGLTMAQIREAAKPLKSGKAAKPQTDAKNHADPGYQPDKMKRYALDTKAQAKAAWSFINQADNAKNYSANQLKRIKGRIIKALKSFGVTVTAEHYLIDPAQELTETTTLAECMGDCYSSPETAGSFYVSLTNGPVTVTVSSYTVDPADLDLIGRAAMDGACACLATIDPDMDGDMDVPGASAEDTDHDMPEDDAAGANVPGTACPCGCNCAIPVDPDAANCPCACDDCDVCGSAPTGATTGEAVGPQPTPTYPEPTAPTAVETTDPPAPTPAADHTETEAPAMSEPTTAVEPTPAAAPIAAPAATFTFDQVQALLATFAAAPRESAPAPAVPVAEAVAPPVPAAPPVAAPVAPAPVPVAETMEQMVARLVAEGVAAAQTSFVQTLAESGVLGGRKGLTAQNPAATNAGQVVNSLGEGANSYGMPAGAPDKPLHQYTTEELNRWAGPMVFEHAVGHYANRR